MDGHAAIRFYLAVVALTVVMPLLLLELQLGGPYLVLPAALACALWLGRSWKGWWSPGTSVSHWRTWSC